jgi:pimeloyl-ACP methyl ester carboxylesterase
MTNLSRGEELFSGAGRASSTLEYDLATAVSDAMASKTLVNIVLLWIVLEILFATIVYWIILPELHKLKPPAQYHGDIVQMMKKTFEEVKNIKCYTFEMYVSGFCNGAKFEDIGIDNFRSFLAWGMYHKYLDTLDDQEEKEVAEVLEHIATLHPEIHKLKPGLNPKVSNCSMTLEPIPIIHRPLLFYVLVNLTETLANAVFLRACGFHSMEHDGTHYWYKANGNESCGSKSEHCSDGKEPLVFLHGISTGWMLYMNIVKKFGAHRPLLLVDVDAIKVKSLNFDMPTPEKFAKSVYGILQKHSINQASIVGHSFGSVTAGWFVRYFPEKVSHLALVDPVTLLLSFPEVAYSFLYREPTTMIEWFIHLAAARELTVSHALRRHFWWYNNTLWLEDVPAHIGVVVGLSSNDEIIHPQAVFEYTENCRQQRLALRREAKHQLELATTSRRVTRSMGSVPAVGADSAAEGAGKKSGHNNSGSVADGVTLPPVAMIEVVMWEGYSHGQILLPSKAQREFVQMVKCNEKIGSTY